MHSRTVLQFAGCREKRAAGLSATLSGSSARLKLKDFAKAIGWLV
jgi:hypothetical protein